MNKYGALIEPTTLQFERLLPGPLERVWEYITDGEKRALWFAGGPTDLTAGGSMKLIFNNSQFSSPPDPTPAKYEAYGDGHVSEATVLKCEPQHLFVIEWEGVVTFELEEVNEKVKLTLTHSKLPETKDAIVGTLAGWHTHLNILEDRMQEKAPKGFWKVHMPLEEEYGERMS